MQQAYIRIVTTGLLIFGASIILPQATYFESTSEGDITLRVESAQNPIHVGSNLVLKVAVVNKSSNVFMIVPGTPMTSRFKIYIRDKNGKEPKETASGCVLHRSVDCGSPLPEVRRGSSMSFRMTPSSESHSELEISSEYKIDHPGTYSVSIALLDAQLYMVPAGTGQTWRDFYSVQETDRIKRTVREIQSNSVLVKVVP